MRLYFRAGSIGVQSAPKRRPIPYISPPSTLPDFTMSRSSSSPLSYVTLPDPQARTPSRQSLPPPSSPPPAASASTSSSQPQSRPVSETKPELQGSEQRTFTQTLTAGLAELTDLTLANRSDLEEVKQLIYGRYAKEDECKEKCKAQCAEIRHAVASVTERFTRRATSADAARTTTGGQDEGHTNRLLQELDALHEEREQMVRQYTADIREMQDYQTHQIIRAIRRVREDKRPQAQQQSRQRQEGARTRTTGSRGGRM